MQGVLWIRVTIKWRHQTSDAHDEIVDSNTFQILGGGSALLSARYGMR